MYASLISFKGTFHVSGNLYRVHSKSTHFSTRLEATVGASSWPSHFTLQCLTLDGTSQLISSFTILLVFTHYCHRIILFIQTDSFAVTCCSHLDCLVFAGENWFTQMVSALFSTVQTCHHFLDCLNNGKKESCFS